MSHFGSKLGRRAAIGGPVRGLLLELGPLTFAQEVLVPELLVLLVQEDLSVSEERAQQILEDSAEIGELLNPAAD